MPAALTHWQPNAQIYYWLNLLYWQLGRGWTIQRCSVAQYHWNSVKPELGFIAETAAADWHGLQPHRNMPVIYCCCSRADRCLELLRFGTY